MTDATPGPQVQPQQPAANQPASLPPETSASKGLRFAKVLVWVVYAYFVLALIILSLNFFLQLFNANPDAGFTEWVYRSSDRVLEPFRGIFPSPTAGNGSVIDFAVLFAIIVYGIIAMLVQHLIGWIDRRIAEERNKAYYLDAQNRDAQNRANANRAAPR